MLLLGEILRRHAAVRGDKVAYVMGDVRVTYRTMNAGANRLAHVLHAHGVGRGDRVAILAANVPLYPEAYFAAAKLGAILVPVNARYKEAEIEYAVNQSAATLLLFAAEHAGKVEALERRLPDVRSFLRLDGEGFGAPLRDLLERAADAEPAADVRENDPHVMLYTSGTTGRPKGVLSSHRSYVLSAAQGQNGLRLGEEDVGVSMFPMFHMGGWALPLGRRIRSAFPAEAMVLIYGSTEAGAGTMLRPPDILRKPTSVGRPAINVDVRLVDEGGRDVADGDAGEILCRSDFLMLGYWKMPEATEAALRGGWYHTGDLAVRDEEGFLNVVGRAKDMIKTGGENVFPAEVEAALLEHPDVAEAAVFGVPDDVWGESVVAAVVRRSPALDASAVVEHVKSRLAGYKKPRQVFFVEALPRTAATGRVQKPLLRDRFIAERTRRC